MPEEPDNLETPEPEESAEEERDLSEAAEHVWPPPDAQGESEPVPDIGSGDADWSREVEKIDEAIGELREINDALPATGPVVPSSEAEAEEMEDVIAEISQGIEQIDAVIDRDVGEGAAVDGGGGPPGAGLSFTGGPSEGAEASDVGAETRDSQAPAAGTSASRRRVRDQSEDELGQLWGNVFFSAEHPPPRGIIVTAARTGDGATQIAVGLSLIGAEASSERLVALVDFNLRNASIAKVLGIQAEPGLTDVLDGRCALETAMHRVQLKNGNALYVLPSGAPVDKPLGLLKSRQVQSLISQLQDRFDHTIIDVAAASEHPDPQVVGSLVDGALMVVRAGMTPRETVAEAKRRLDLAGVRWLGIVLNQRSDPIPGFLYRMT